jgi:hypothetical protein
MNITTGLDAPLYQYRSPDPDRMIDAALQTPDTPAAFLRARDRPVLQTEMIPPANAQSAEHGANIAAQEGLGCPRASLANPPPHPARSESYPCHLAASPTSREQRGLCHTTACLHEPASQPPRVRNVSEVVSERSCGYMRQLCLGGRRRRCGASGVAQEER